VLIRIDPQSAVPIYEQIAHEIKAAAARGELAEGHKLPSIRELARDLTINPNTVVRAYDALERDRVILRRRGAGCFLTGRRSDLRLAIKREQVRELMDKTVTDAFHLGLSATEIRRALEQCLARVCFDRRDPA
jgi:GntR family transcriptional regulator